MENINKYFPEPEETVKVKGHMNYQRQGVRSTKSKDFQEPNSISETGKKEKCVSTQTLYMQLNWPSETVTQNISLKQD